MYGATEGYSPLYEGYKSYTLLYEVSGSLYEATHFRIGLEGATNFHGTYIELHTFVYGLPGASRFCMEPLLP